MLRSVLLLCLLLSFNALSGPVKQGDIDPAIVSEAPLSVNYDEGLYDVPVAFPASNEFDDSVFERGYSAVVQWSQDWLLSPVGTTKPKGFMAIFKTLGLFIVLMSGFVVYRLIKLRRLRSDRQPGHS